MKNYHRCATIFASVLTCLEGIIWLVLAILSITIYTCDRGFPFATNYMKLDDLMFRAYYLGSCEGPSQSTLPPSSFRTYVFMIIYSIASAVWIPASILLLAGALLRISGTSTVCMYLPWILFTAFIQFLDLTATIFYAIDITQTTTVSDFTDFLKPYQFNVTEEYDGITVVPAIIMTVFFSRGIIIWVINIIFLGVVVQAYTALVRERRTRKQMERREERYPTMRPSPEAGKWVVASDRHPVYSRQSSEPIPRPYSPEKYPNSPQITTVYSRYDPNEVDQRSKPPFNYMQPNQQLPYIPRPDYPVENKVSFYPPQNQPMMYPILPRVRSGSFSSSTSGGMKPNSGGY